MSTIAKQPVLAPRLRGLLRGVRWRIRAYTLVQGLAMLVCWLAFMFWFALLCDYGPVWMGASEMPQAARAFLLGVAGLGGAYILYRWVLRRTFARLADHSMAILLERGHDEFHDSLLTAVEMHERPDHAAEFNPQMLDHAGEDALALAPAVRVRRVFNWIPLWSSLVAAAFAAASLALFALAPATAETFQTAAKRIVLLDEAPWRRMALLEVAGVTRWSIEYDPTDAADRNSLGDHRPRLVPVEAPFDENLNVRVARGSDPRLTIKAEIAEHTRPGEVTLYWSTLDEAGNADDSGRVGMEESRTSDGYLHFHFARGPLKKILKDVRFHAIGYDYRTPQYHVQVVDEPTLVDVQVIHQRPDYLVDEQRSVFKTVAGPLIAGTKLPRGSRVTFAAKSNKPLKRVYIYNVGADQTEVIDVAGEDDESRRNVRFTIDELQEDVALQWWLVDEDDLVSETPRAVGVGVQDDDPPQVDVAARGIGSAITPDATFPLAGKIVDDHWLDRAWLELNVAGAPPRTIELSLTRGGFDEQQIAQWKVAADDNVYHRVDLREQRQRNENPLKLKPGDKVTLAVKASDLYNLNGYGAQENPHTGVGDPVQLDVVTPDELLSLLERRELELRRRLEQIYEEMTQMRDGLVRVENELSESASTDDNGGGAAEDRAVTDASEPGDAPPSPEEKARRAKALRNLRVQRAVNQSEKSRGETEGVARAVLKVVDQLENNRVDTEDRKVRLRDQVSAPLLDLVAVDFIELDKRLEGLNQQVNQSGEIDRPQAALAARQAVAQADGVLLKFDGVLSKMVDMESFAEVLDKFRDLIAEQERIEQETKTARKNDLFGQ